MRLLWQHSLASHDLESVNPQILGQALSRETFLTDRPTQVILKVSFA
jgi:hypothetical protein